MSLFEQTTAFDLKKIKPGDMVTLHTQGHLFATGIITQVNPLRLQVLIYMIGQKAEDWTIDQGINALLEQMSPYTVEVEKVINREIMMTVIDPETLEMVNS